MGRVRDEDDKMIAGTKPRDRRLSHGIARRNHNAERHGVLIENRVVSRPTRTSGFEDAWGIGRQVDSAPQRIETLLERQRLVVPQGVRTKRGRRFHRRPLS